MMRFNVFGRTVGVKAVANGWEIYRVDVNENKYSRLYEYVIPAEVKEEELAQWLNDIFHEMATSKNPEVRRID